MLHRFNNRSVHLTFNLLKSSGSTALASVLSGASMDFKQIKYFCYTSRTYQRIKHPWTYRSYCTSILAFISSLKFAQFNYLIVTFLFFHFWFYFFYLIMLLKIIYLFKYCNLNSIFSFFFFTHFTLYLYCLYLSDSTHNYRNFVGLIYIIIVIFVSFFFEKREIWMVFV